MALTKRLYKNHETVITAQNMNDIQDAILALEQQAGIVPGEGETTKVINVINPAGVMTAAQATAHPDGLYWVDQPIIFRTADQSGAMVVQGLTSKRELTWYAYDTWTAGTTDENGVLVQVEALARGPVVQSIAVVKAVDSVTLTFGLADGSTEEQRVVLTDGIPTGIVVGGATIPLSMEGFE